MGCTIEFVMYVQVVAICSVNQREEQNCESHNTGDEGHEGSIDTKKDQAVIFINSSIEEPSDNTSER